MTSAVRRGEVNSPDNLRVQTDFSPIKRDVNKGELDNGDPEPENVPMLDDQCSNDKSEREISVSRGVSEGGDFKDKREEGNQDDPDESCVASHNEQYYQPEALSALNSSQLKKLQRAKEFCREQTIKLLPLISKVSGNTSYPQPQDLALSLDSRTYAVMSRIYVGSINFELNEQHIRMIFSQFGYVKDVSMTIDPDTGRHKGYCFVEFEAPEAAHLALKHMNGTELAGRQLKVGRPNNYNSAIAAATPTQIPTRIYISNVNEHITEENISSIFEAFGALKACVLLFDPISLKHKTNGYVEFVDESAVEDTVDNMNGFELGGLNLYVMKAIYGGSLPMGVTKLKSLLQSLGIPSLKQADSKLLMDQTTLIKNAPVNIANNVINHKKQAQDPQNEESVFFEENMYISASQRYSIMQKLSRNSPEAQNTPSDKTQTFSGVCLQNIALVKDVDEDFSSEILAECGKFGEVAKMVISSRNGPDSSSSNPADLVVVYILYKSPDSASRAQAALDKRFFAGRIVSANLCESHIVNTHATNAIKVEDMT